LALWSPSVSCQPPLCPSVSCQPLLCFPPCTPLEPIGLLPASTVLPPLHPVGAHWSPASLHCAHRSPASLCCASPPAPPPPAIRPQLAHAQQHRHRSPSPPRLGALGEQQKTRSCFCVYRYTPKWTARKRGREGTDKFWRACRGAGSAGWLWRDALGKLGSDATGVTAWQSHRCTFPGQGLHRVVLSRVTEAFKAGYHSFQ